MKTEKCGICGYEPSQKEYVFDAPDGVCELCLRLGLQPGDGGEANDMKRAICHVGNVIREDIWRNGNAN
ncbi:MAG TPA: hypothetical protein VGQ76_06340 [Thermoanaerobaculia bacterium]|nr:hypothetical protein [Thermoanaerobaculia bacterium]